MFTVEFVLCAQHDKSSQEPSGRRNNKLITTGATGLSRTAVFVQTPATPKTLARTRGGLTGVYSRTSQRFLRHYQQEMMKPRGPSRLRVSLLFVLLAALIRGNFQSAIIGGLADKEGGNVPLCRRTLCQSRSRCCHVVISHGRFMK